MQQASSFSRSHSTLSRRRSFVLLSTSKMGKLEDQLAQAVEDGKVPHVVVFATNKDGTIQRHSFMCFCGRCSYIIRQLDLQARRWKAGVRQRAAGARGCRFPACFADEAAGDNLCAADGGEGPVWIGRRCLGNPPRARGAACHCWPR